MTILKTILCATAASLALAGAASAAEVTYNAGVANDYVFRGLDQSPNSDGQLFLGADITESNVYGGVWISNTGPEGDIGAEYDIYAGVKPTWGGATFDFGAIFYGYTGSPTINSYLNTTEFKAAVSYPAGPVTVGGAVYYSPKNGGFGDEATTYMEANAAYTFAFGGTVSAAYGNFSVDIPGPNDYDTWNIGVTYPFMERYSVDVRYHGSSDDADVFNTVAAPDIADDHFVLTLKATF